MTAVDSQTVMALGTSDPILNDSQDDSNEEGEVLTVTSEGESASDEPDPGPLTYLRKGNANRPVSGGMRANQASKSKLSSSSRNNPPANPTHPHPVASNPIRGKVNTSPAPTRIG